MISSLVSVLLAVAMGAPGDIYRCSDAAGKVSFQDHPCVSGNSAQLARHGEDAATSERELRQWLDGYRKRQPLAQSRPAGGTGHAIARDPVAYSGGAVTEAQLAVCSERFLDCAQGDAAAMDACVDRLPRCGASSSAPCCPQACVGRYQSLRGSGEELAASVRLALLDPSAPACGTGAVLR